MSWNYRMTREKVTDPEGTEQYLYSLREVYYDEDGKPNGWSAEPTTFVGVTPGELVESLITASGAWPHDGVLDLETRETVWVTYHGKEKSL